MPAISRMRSIFMLPFVLLVLMAGLVATDVSTAPEASALTRVEKIRLGVKIAQNQKGDPYSYGSAGPDRFDCSGLLYYAFRKAGISVPRTTTTGLFACAASATAVEPTSSPVTVPRPREPTTTSRALLDSSTSRPAAPQHRTSVVISTSGAAVPCTIAPDLSKGPLNMSMRGDGQDMTQLSELLTQLTARPVRDKTGLSGRYDFDMKMDLQMVLALAKRMGANIPAAAANIPQADGSSLMTALNEQLGLKLESARDGVTVVVIDRVEAALAD